MTKNEFNQVKEEILENTYKLFLKYGIRSTSMDDICFHLKISKKTLYQHFSNKDDIVEQVLTSRLENHQTQKNLEELKQENSIQSMLIIRDHIIQSFNSRMPSNLFDLKKYHPEVYQRINEKEQLFIQNLYNDIIEKGVKDGYFRTNINKEIQVYLFTKQMSLLGDPEIMSELQYPIPSIVSTIIENMIRSFSTSKGIQELELLLKQRNNTNN